MLSGGEGNGHDAIFSMDFGLCPRTATKCLLSYFTWASIKSKQELVKEAQIHTNT